MSWEKVLSLADLEQKRVSIFKKGPRQVVVLKKETEIFAFDNRCPHEGYPLAEGKLDEGCVLTCKWHNWKFDLMTGQCVLGGDNVRIYQTKVESNDVWVNLTDPPIAEIENSILDGLRIAFEKRDLGRISRELARLHYNQLDMKLALIRTIHWSHNRLEYGTTHAYAAASDWLALYNNANDDLEKRIICLTEAIDHIAHDSLRHRIYPFPERTLEVSAANLKESFFDPFLDAVENEDEERAIGLLLGALAAGLSFDDLEHTLCAAALKHYNDFGHSLIYVQKTGELLRALGREIEKPLLLALVRSLCYCTREDLLPDFRAYAPHLKEFESLVFCEEAKTQLASESLFKQPVKAALRWVLERAPDFPPENILTALVESCAHNMLYFDTGLYFSPYVKISDTVGWLDFTHALTFGNAVRHMCRKYPDLWKPGLLQMACFSGRNHSYLDIKIDADAFAVQDRAEFFDRCLEQILDHGVGLPIFSAHLLKTSSAIQDELKYVHKTCAVYLVSALNRFLKAPLKQKHVRRTVRHGIELIARDFT